jgi:hypothetical protein
MAVALPMRINLGVHADQYPRRCGRAKPGHHTREEAPLVALIQRAWVALPQSPPSEGRKR